MLKRLLALLRRKGLAAESGKEVRRLSFIASNDFDLSLNERVRASAGKTILAGSLQLFGLDDVKQSLGTLWSGVADQVHRISQEEICARLSEGDVFRRCNNQTFLICFCDSDEKVAARIAYEISNGIRERIKAEIPIIAGRISVSATTAAVTSEDLRDAVDISERLLKSLQRVRDDMQRTVLKHRSTILQGCTPQFFPAISPIKNRIVFNTCVASTITRTPSLTALRAMAEPEQYQEALSRLDLRLLVSAVEALHLTNKQRGCCPILVPVRLDTLRNDAMRPEYVKLRHAIPERYRRFILLEITGLATPADGLEVIFVAPELQSRVGRLVLEVAIAGFETLALAQFPIWGVSTSLAGRSSTDPELPGRLRRYVQWAAESRLSVIGHGANSFGLALLAQKAGFSAIDGPAVHSATSHPKPPFSVAPLDRGSAVLPLTRRRG